MRSIYANGIFPVVLVCAVYLAAPPPAHAGPGGLYPILDCVSYNQATQEVTAVWGYVDTNSSSTIVPFGSDNFFDPPPGYRLQPIEFLPGIHHNVFSTTFFLSDTTHLSWTLDGTTLTASNNPALYCSSSPPKFTYQGRLKEAATRSYRLIISI